MKQIVTEGVIEIPPEWLAELDEAVRSRGAPSRGKWSDVEIKILRIYYLPLKRDFNIKLLCKILNRRIKAIYSKALDMESIGLLHGGTIEENKRMEGL